MKFSDFMQQQRVKKKYTSSKEHFEKLGGEKKLGFSIRNFYLIESEKLKPTENLFTALYEVTPARDRKTLVIAYLSALLPGESKTTEEVIQYLEQYLAPAVEAQSESIWVKKPFQMYSDEQLDYLNKNEDAMRLHQRVLVLDKTPIKEARLPAAKLKKMQRLALVRVQGGTIYPHHSCCKLPNYENNNPRSVSRASDFILKQFDLYMNKEGASDQQLGYAIQLVTPDVAQLILEQTRNFKQWVQSLASAETSQDHVPLVHVSLTKKLRQSDL